MTPLSRSPAPTWATSNCSTVDTLKIVAQRGFEAPFLAFFNTVHDGLAACGTAMQRGERVIVEDVAASPLFAGLTRL